jgi:hypothetical protein
MIHLRLAWVLAHEIHGTPWEEVCLTKGLDPSSATADDVLGPMSTRMTHDGGKPVLPVDDERVTSIVDEMEAEPVVDVDPRQFVREVTEIAGLTRQERRVVSAIVDGSPIPDGKQYTGPLARRLGSTPDAVKKTWSRAKRKLRDNWSAE